MSLRENVLAAFATTLAASVAAGHVYRSRQDALGSDELPAVVIEPLSESAVETSLGMLDRTLSVRVAAYGRSTPGDTELDATLAAIETAILADRTLGLGAEVQVASQFDTAWEFGEQDGVRAALDFQVMVRTAL